MSLVDDLESSIDIVDLVWRYTKLKKTGTNYKSICPFPGHNEKTPSFVVSPAKQIGYCFGCHKWGWPIKFLMDIENMEFRDALQTLGNITGREIPWYTESKEKIEIKKNLYSLYKDACSYYKASLKKHPEVKKYLSERWVLQEEIDKFQFGYADSGVGLYNFLKEKWYDDPLIESSQIFVELKARKDKFISRIIFPISNLRGDIVGFAGRIIGSGEPKYLNSPASHIYDKSSILYWLYEARSSITKNDRVIITEWYMDTIALHRAGFFEAVAVSGTALTEKHITLLKRLTHKIYLCFDNDKAWEQATRNSLEILKNKGLEIKIILLKWAKDPDEYLEKGKDFSELIVSARSPIMYFIEKNSYNLESIDEKKKFLTEILEVTESYSDPVEQDMYLKEVAKMSHTPLQILYEMSKKRRYRTKTEPSKPPEITLTPEDMLLAFLYEFVEFFSVAKKELVFLDGAHEWFMKSLEEAWSDINALSLEKKEQLRGLGMQLSESLDSPEQREKKLQALIWETNKYHFKRLWEIYKWEMNSWDTLALQKYSELMKKWKEYGMK